MAYAQINYPDIQGINGTYRISQIGCFLTSFCNLLLRLGEDNIAPNELNIRFIQKNIYIDLDDGVRDDLNFQLITKLYPNVVVKQEGSRTSHMPTHSNAIVRIAAGNEFGTHFCLVDHIANGVVWVVDSYDGKVKKASAYGPIQGWATYELKKGNNMEKPINDGDLVNISRELDLPLDKVKAANWHDIFYKVIVPQVRELSKEKRINSGDLVNIKNALGSTPKGSNWHDVFYQSIQPKLSAGNGSAEKKLQQIKDVLEVK